MMLLVEYFDIAATYGGTVINLSAYTRNYVNPLNADLFHINEKGLRDVIAGKSEFMLGLCAGSPYTMSEILEGSAEKE